MTYPANIQRDIKCEALRQGALSGCEECRAGYLRLAGREPMPQRDTLVNADREEYSVQVTEAIELDSTQPSDCRISHELSERSGD